MTKTRLTPTKLESLDLLQRAHNLVIDELKALAQKAPTMSPGDLKDSLTTVAKTAGRLEDARMKIGQ